MQFRFIFGENKCVKTHFPDFRSLANIAINPSFSKVSEKEQISDSGNAVLQGFIRGFDENADFQKAQKHSCRPTFLDSGPRRGSANVSKCRGVDGGVDEGWMRGRCAGPTPRSAGVAKPLFSFAFSMIL